MTDPAPLFADSTTLEDLELESRAEPGATVFAAFARPHSDAGAVALRFRLGRPMTRTADIEQTQRAVRDCLKTIGVFEKMIAQAQPERVQRYMSSQMDTTRVDDGFGGRIASSWTAARHAECVAVAREGRECMTRLVASCREWVAHSKATHEAESVKKFTAGIDSAIEQIAEILGSHGTSRVDLLKVDQLLRDDHAWASGYAIEMLGELDALHALAATGEARGWVFPALREGPPHLVIKGLRHPLIALPVENDSNLCGDNRLMLLTGPNMAGKTTYLKAVGIVVYLAQLGMAVPACSMELTPFDRLVTVIGIHDTVASGSSAFHYEVTRLGRGLDGLIARQRCLLLFDELMRGTNAADAQEACRLVIESLLQSKNCCAILATHLAGLVDEFADDRRLTLGHFAAEMKDDALAYDYRLRSGGYQGRMAMALLHQMGISAKLASLRQGTTTSS